MERIRRIFFRRSQSRVAPRWWAGSVATNKARGAYRISVSQLRRLRTLAERRQKSGQREVCGLILSDDGFRLKLAYLPNQASRPGEFLIKGQAYESARDRAKRQGESTLGTFHSHPVSEAIPGAGDIKNATSGSLMLIYDVCGREAKLWKIRKVRGGAKQENSLSILAREWRDSRRANWPLDLRESEHLKRPSSPGCYV
jgi:proteasome lid subunit RPN8/RPN11